jgi:cytochrome b
MPQRYTKYTTWSPSVRWFHWINVLAILCLIFVGLLMLYKKKIGITGLDAKIGLKELHVIIGYIFVSNLFVRFIFAFIGPKSAKFSSFLPGKGFIQSLKSYHASLKSGGKPQFIGHNPVGKLAVTLLFTLLLILSISGLIRAGTDIYYPPFGSFVTSYIADDGVDPDQLKPYQAEGVNKDKQDSINPYKSVVGKIHLYTAYFLMFVVMIHIVAVVRAEVKEDDNLVSSMFSGKKLIAGKPEDE